MAVPECQTPKCTFLPRFKVSSIRKGKPSGGYLTCGRHLTGMVDYVTVPGSSAHVERLP